MTADDPLLLLRLDQQHNPANTTADDPPGQLLTPATTSWPANPHPGPKPEYPPASTEKLPSPPRPRRAAARRRGARQLGVQGGKEIRDQKTRPDHHRSNPHTNHTTTGPDHHTTPRSRSRFLPARYPPPRRPSAPPVVATAKNNQ